MTIRLAGIRLFLLALLAALIVAPPALAADTNVLFILDGSGSMWERVDGQPKIVTAKAVLDKVLSTLPSGTAMGLMTYGVRRKGDCTDIQVLSPVGSENAAAIQKKVNALMPKGDTPIAGTLARIPDAFKGRTGRKTVVFVTDGAEECHADPCAAAKTLAASDVDLQINLVGFNLGKKEHDAVQCIVDAGRGKYYDAKDAAGLTLAMTQVQAQLTTPTPPPPPPPPPNLLSPSQGGEVIAAPGPGWEAAVSGKDADMVGTPCGGGWPVEIVFAFKNQQPATFSRFDILIPGTGNYIKDFELLAATDSPTGTYRSLGKFTTANMLMIKSPYQAFTFAPTTAKYVKLRLISTSGGGCPGPLTQIRLVGKLAGNGAPPPPAGPAPGDTNILAASAGGQVVAAPDPTWSAAISGKDSDAVGTPCGGGWPVEAVFAFKDEKPATFSRFEILIPGAGNYIQTFELLAASDSPTGTYRSLGKFTTQNMLMVKSPYQAFSFAPVTAKYLKVRLISTSGGGCPGPLTQIRLFGKPAS